MMSEGNRVSRQRSIAICVSLSATGSIALPSVVIMLKRRAMMPSAVSLIPESSSTSAVARSFFSPQYVQTKTGINTMRKIDKILGIVHIRSSPVLLFILCASLTCT